MTSLDYADRAARDATLLEAVLAGHGPCRFDEMVDALDWSAARTHLALDALDAHLRSNEVYRLVRDRHEIGIEPAPDALPRTVATRLANLRRARMPLSVDEAQSLLDLVHQHLAAIHDYEPVLPAFCADDRQTQERRLVHAHHKDTAGFLESVPVAHPDVLFALCLIPVPTTDPAPHEADEHAAISP